MTRSREEVNVKIVFNDLINVKEPDMTFLEKCDADFKELAILNYNMVKTEFPSRDQDRTKIHHVLKLMTDLHYLKVEQEFELVSSQNTNKKDSAEKDMTVTTALNEAELATVFSLVDTTQTLLINKLTQMINEAKTEEQIFSQRKKGNN